MAQIATLEDFQILQKEIHLIQENINELKVIVGTNKTSTQQWLRSTDVRRLLGISHGKLQKMRDREQIKFTRIDGVIFYLQSDIETLMRNHK